MLIFAPDPAMLPESDWKPESRDGDSSDEDAAWIGTDRPYWIYEEEGTRSGVTIARTYQLSCWIDGTTHP